MVHLGPRRGLHLAILSTLILGSLACSRQETDLTLDQAHTDVLLLTLCTLRADHVGAYGYPANVSPNIDRLAASGVLFEHTLAPAPWTRPSVAAMVTGIYPRSLAIQEREQVFNSRALLDGFDTLAERLSRAGYYTIGLTANPNTNALYNFQQGYDYYRDTGKQWEQGYDKKPLTAEDLADRLRDQLRGLSRGKRVFAHLVFVDVHGPYRADHALARTQGFQPKTETAAYDLFVRYTDAVIGDILAEFDQLGRHNLLVIVDSDHGQGFGTPHPADVGHGFQLYNSTIWVPLIFHHPALAPRPRRIAETVELVDLLPTVLDLLGIQYHEDALDGRSLAAAVRDGQAVREHPAHVVETSYGPGDKSAILANGWKLIATYEAPKVPPEKLPAYELYRYGEDPQEARDRLAAEPETVEHLRAELAAWQATRDARAPSSALRVEVPEEAKEALRALGYIVGD